MQIKTIMCCCGAGVATSLLLQMAVEQTLRELNITGVTVRHGTFDEALRLVNAASPEPVLCVTGRALEKFAAQIPSVLLVNHMQAGEELTMKLSAALNI